MSNINSVTISGRLGRPAELRYTPNGAAVANFSVAVQGYRKDASKEDQPTHWIDVTVWNKVAEIMAERVPKGARVCVHGRLEQQTWNDQQTGAKRSKLVVIANEVDIFDWLDQGQQQAPSKPAQSRQEQTSTGPEDDGFDDIPF